MGRIASIEDFEQGGLYTSYTRYPFFKERATNLKGRITTGKVLIVGCGWGYLVDELVKLGKKVIALDDLSGGFKENVNPKAEFVHGSVTDKELMFGLY